MEPLKLSEIPQSPPCGCRGCLAGVFSPSKTTPTLPGSCFKVEEPGKTIEILGGGFVGSARIALRFKTTGPTVRKDGTLTYHLALTSEPRPGTGTRARPSASGAPTGPPAMN